MHRIDGAGATAQNLFTEGDPTQGVPATTVTGAWLNAVQEEIAGVIEGAGEALDKPDNGQLLAAIQAIVAANLPTAFQTGDVKLTMQAAAPSGWLLCDDGDIGPTGSAATSRANDDTHDLYVLLWANVPDAYAPVTGGRGADAESDWAAAKPIGLTKMLGRSLGIAGAGASLTARTLGEALGAETHQLIASELPAHTHEIRGSSGIASLDVSGGDTWGFSSSGGGLFGDSMAAGGDAAHNNMQPTAFLNAMIKL